MLLLAFVAVGSSWLPVECGLVCHPLTVSNSVKLAGIHLLHSPTSTCGPSSIVNETQLKVFGCDLTLRYNLGAAVVVSAQLQMPIFPNGSGIAHLSCGLEFDGPIGHGINTLWVMVREKKHHIVSILLPL